MDVDGDRFVFSVGFPMALEPDAAGRPGWRFSINCTLAGKTFASVRLDVVLRGEELAATERITLPGFLAFADVPPRTIESVDRRQHFAEKLHALTRDYGDRPNTRVKDLVDMVLLIEDGLPPDGALLDVVNHVFTARATHPVPPAIPDPPPVWAKEYPKLAGDRTLGEPDLAVALDLVRKLWAQALTTETEV